MVAIAERLGGDLGSNLICVAALHHPLSSPARPALGDRGRWRMRSVQPAGGALGGARQSAKGERGELGEETVELAMCHGVVARLIREAMRL